MLTAKQMVLKVALLLFIGELSEGMRIRRTVSTAIHRDKSRQNADADSACEEFDAVNRNSNWRSWTKGCKCSYGNVLDCKDTSLDPDSATYTNYIGSRKFPATLNPAKCKCRLLVPSQQTQTLATFDGVQETTASWRNTNDPVMGGSSKATFKVTSDKTGLFEGTCAIVDSLQAPGFAKIAGSATFSDITDYDNIAMRVRSTTPEYLGFKVAFAAPEIPKASRFSTGSYKADFNVTGSDWQVVEVPLKKFSYDWSAYTGRCDSKDPPGSFSGGVQHYCCSESGLEPSKPEVCVDNRFLSKIDGVELWAEGVEGDFSLEIDWIGATRNSLNDGEGQHIADDIMKD